MEGDVCGSFETAVVFLVSRLLHGLLLWLANVVKLRLPSPSTIPDQHDMLSVTPMMLIDHILFIRARLRVQALYAGYNT